MKQYRRFFRMLILPVAALAAVLPAIPAVYAATDTPTASDTAKIRQIEDLKERLATKVAELTETKKAAVFGTVTSITLTTVSVETNTKEVKIELTDDINVFQTIKGKRTRLTPDDIEKGDQVTVFGDYDATLDLLKGKVIVIDGDKPVRIFGTISDVNGDDYTVTVAGTDNQTYTVDYERTTKAFAWENDPNLTKIGFSKLAAGDSVSILGAAEPKVADRLSAARILDLGALNGAKSPADSRSAGAASPKPTSATAN